MKQPSILAFIRDILLLPFTVTIIIPYLLYNDVQFLPDNIFIRPAGILVCSFGLTLFSYTLYLFRSIGRGTLASWSPTKKLVIQGPYRYCRNPMITGVLFILLGESLFFNSANILIWAVVFFIFNNVYFTFFEELSLERRFGEEYIDYKKSVPRWLPKLKPYTKAQ